MTEFGKAVKELAAEQLKLDGMHATLADALQRGDGPQIEAAHAELTSVLTHTLTGTLGQKLAKFKAKAEQPPSERLYSDAMVEKVLRFATDADTFRTAASQALLPLEAWLDERRRREARLAEIALQMQVVEAEEGTPRAGVAFDEEEGCGRLGVLLEGDESWCLLVGEFRQEAGRIVRRLENREKSKAKKKQKQAELRQAAQLRKEREQEQREDELAQALEALTRRVVTKEAKRRLEMEADQEGEYSGLLAAAPQPAVPAAGARNRSPPRLAGGRKTPPMGPSPVPSPSGRRAREQPSGGGGAPQMQEAALSQLPGAVLQMTFDVAAIPNTPSVELRNRTHGVVLNLYRCLLRLRDGPGSYGSADAFVMPEELLTDRKAKKRYLAAQGGQSQRPADKVHFDPTDDASDDDSASGDEDDDLLEDAEEEAEEEYVNPYRDSDDDDDASRATVLPATVGLAYLQRLMEGCVVVMMSVGGCFAGGVFINGECVCHTTFSRYITRKKQGGRQSAHEGRTDTVGSQMRRQHEIRFKELVAEQLAVWRVPLHHAAAVVLHAPAPVNKAAFYNPSPLPAACTAKPYALQKKDTRIFPVPFTTHKPSFTEVKRVYESLLSCRYAQV